MNNFNGLFADKIEQFIDEKQAMGFSYSYSIKIFRQFERFCKSCFPGEARLTKELCLAWAVRRENERGNSLHTRIAPIREFAKYLRRLGEDAYVLPYGFGNSRNLRVPYIFSKREIGTFWNALDHMRRDKRFPLRHIVVPMMFKLLYCCGLRTAEVRKLQISDVDIKSSRLVIRESKGHKSRIVVMSDDVAFSLNKCIGRVSAMLPECPWAFPKQNGDYYGQGALSGNFHKICDTANIVWNSGFSPRPYDFRHTFATHRFYQWMDEGEDLYALLPYLSAYMGHELLSDTEYYIHLVPGLFAETVGERYAHLQNLLPEVM